MRTPFARGPRRPPFDVPRGERVLAWAPAREGAVAGTREAVYLGEEGREPVRIAWEDVQAADWDAEEARLRVSEVGTWGAPRLEYAFTIEEPGTLLELVRERVTSTVLLERHVATAGKRGVRVIARRATTGEREVRWIYEFDEGVDPDAPTVRAAAREALVEAQRDLGLG